MDSGSTAPDLNTLEQGFQQSLKQRPDLNSLERGYQATNPTQSVAANLRQSLLQAFSTGPIPGAPVMASVANTLSGGKLIPADIETQGLAQGWADKGMALLKTMGTGSSKFADDYKSAVGDLVTRRQQGMSELPYAGKALEVGASAIPYMLGGAVGGLPKATSMLGKLATTAGNIGIGAGVGAGAAGVQAAGAAQPGQEASAAKGAMPVGGFLGGGLTAAGLAGAATYRAFMGPSNPTEAAVQWLKTTGAFRRPIEEYENQMVRRLATRPPGSPLLMAQLGDDKITKDLIKNVASSSPSAMKMIEKVADEHGAMADPFYAKAFQQAVPLNAVQAAHFANVPEAKIAWMKATKELGPLPDPVEGAPVPVKAMDFIKRELDRAVNSTKEYVARSNLMLMRDAVMDPVKSLVPDYAKATAISSVEQSLRAGVVAGAKAMNRAAVRGNAGFPNPAPEAAVGFFARLLHGNPAMAGTLYGLRAAANMARKATGWAADRSLSNGAQLLLEPAASGLGKMAGEVGTTSPTSVLPGVLGGLGGSAGAQLVPDER